MPKELALSMQSVGDDGYGVGTYSKPDSPIERTVRIKNALPDETVTARMLKRRQGEWFGEALSISEGTEANVRRAPPCEFFPRCGGCAVQHMDYSAQLQLKQSGLMAALTANQVQAARFLPPVFGPRFNYRTKARFGVRVVGDEVLVGFRESFSNRVGRMSACLTLTEALSGLIDPLQKLIAALSIPQWIPQVEVAAGDRQEALILRHLEPLSEKDQELLQAFAIRHRVRVYTQSGGYDTVTPASPGAENPYLSYGNPDYGLNLQFEPADFTQVNLQMNLKLVRGAIASLNATPGSRVLDLFCGIGNFSLPLAAAGMQVRGLEAAAPAIDRANMNARYNGLSGRCEFAVQDLYDADCLNLGQAEYLLLDPPRSGAGPNLAAWLETTGARRVAYVSCSPKSFAQDAAVLKQAGFSLEQVGIYDMFPNTAHVETLGIFQRAW
jgi:23S rRNA (uracil1939-C5)-methyltransferase